MPSSGAICPVTTPGYLAMPLAATAGTPEGRSSLSSRTRETSPQVSYRPRQIGTSFLSHDGLNPARYRLHWRTAKPLGPLQPQDAMSRHSRCQPTPPLGTPGGDQPVSPRSTFYSVERYLSIQHRRITNADFRLCFIFVSQSGTLIRCCVLLCSTLTSGSRVPWLLLALPLWEEEIAPVKLPDEYGPDPDYGPRPT